MFQFQFRRIIVPLLIAIAGCSAMAQGQLHSSTEPIQVTGLLRYQNGQAANDVVVRLESLSGGVFDEVRTDRLGKFRFQNLSPKQYQVIVRLSGYRPIQREVNLVMVSLEYVQLLLVPENPSSSVASAPKVVFDANVPEEARREFEKADAVLSTGKKEKIPEGIQHLEKAINLYSSFLEAQLKLGVAYMDLQQWDKAEQALRRALEINPKTANAFFALGEIYWRQKKYEQAEKVLREGLSIEDHSWQGHFALGRLYWSKGDIRKAGPQIGLAIQLNPTFAEAHLLAGNILLRGNKRADALEQFQEYLRLAPSGEYAAQARDAIAKLKQ